MIRRSRAYRRAITLAAWLLLLGALPRPAAAEGFPSSKSLDPWRPPSPSRSGIQVPKRAWVVLAAGGIVARESLRHENAAEAAHVLDRSFLDGPADVGNVWGSGLTIAAGSAGLYGLGALAGTPKLREAGMDLGTAFVATSAVVWPMKLFVDRTRPSGGRYSFPSGHTALAFASAPVLSAHFGPVVGIPAYALAGMTALGRMEERKHYLSDVVFGGAVGLAVGLTVARRASLRSAPEFMLTSRGVALTARF